MLPINLKSEVRLPFRAVGLGVSALLLLFAYIFWRMSGAHIAGLAVSFPPGKSTLFGYPLPNYTMRETYLRFECVVMTTLFLGFAIWFVRLAFRSSTYWSIMEDHIERRVGRRIDTWWMSSVAGMELQSFSHSVKSVWAVKLKLKTGKWLILPWVSKPEAEAVLNAIKLRIAHS